MIEYVCESVYMGVNFVGEMEDVGKSEKMIGVNWGSWSVSIDKRSGRFIERKETGKRHRTKATCRIEIMKERNE